MMTGTAGLASAGLLALEHEIDSEKALKALFEPQPRVKEGMLLSSTGHVTSCMDTSDGLSMSLHELGEASGVSFEVDASAIPIDPELVRLAKIAKTDPLEIALHGGGDYQLLFTVDPEGSNDVLNALGDEVKVIGRCVEGKKNVLKRGRSRMELEPKGYEHFRR
jgi:thiamine-monophosphate kinase